MNENICVTRQPIVDHNRELFAYELLFKDKAADDAYTSDNKPDIQINETEIDKMAGKSLAFLNCDYDFLVSEIPHGLNPESYILEVFTTSLIDGKATDAVKELYDKGFKIALGGYEFTQENSTLIAPIISCLSYCKIEYPKMKYSEKFPKLIEIFHKYKIQVVMEKIDSMSDFRHCHKAGADLYQGYFFAKTENEKPIEIKSGAMGALSILNIMSGNYLEMDITDLESEFKKFPDLTVNLLKYLNSAHFGVRSGITSIRHALSLLGYSRIKRWLLVLAYDNPDVNLEKSPLLMNAMMRANFFAAAAKKLNWESEKSEKAFLMGLISHLDAFYQTSMENILDQISLDAEITKALLEGEGDMGLLLDLMLIVEQGDMEDASDLLCALNLSQRDVNECLITAYTSSLTVA